METQNETIDVKNKSSWDEALENESWITPLIDIFENEDEFVLVANMPGVSKENVRIKLEEGSLVLMGRIDFKNTVDRKYIMNENEFGNYYRKFNLSENVDDSRIEAQLENGQLIVKLPKHDRVKPKNIEIK